MPSSRDPGGPPSDEPPGLPAEVVHASCVALGGRGLLLLGASGTGKSSLALTLMALGARLVADDRTRIEARGGGLWASCPETIRGMIEARGIGLLAADPLPGTFLAAAVDLGRAETERLPPLRTITLLGHDIPLILNGHGLHFAAGLIHYLRGERLK